MQTEDDVRAADEVAAPDHRHGGIGRLPVAVVAAVLVGLHLWLAARADGPSLLWDGLGYLGNARWLGGVDATPWLGPLSFYHAGYPLLLVPFTVLSDDPGTVFRGALLVNVVASVGTFLGLHHLARSFLGLPPRRALLAATAAALYPPVVLQTGFEWSESVFVAAFTATTAAVWWYARRRTPWSAVVVAAAVVGLHLVHPRALPLLPLIGGMFAVGAWRRRVSPRVAGAGAAVLVGGYGATAVLHTTMRSAIYAPRPGGAAAMLGTLLDPSAWSTLAERAAGQLWYLLVATFGLVVVGAVVLGRMARPPVDREVAGTDRVARALVARWALGAVAGVLVASAVQMYEVDRVDHVVYGRYLEATAPVLLLAGLGGALGSLGRRVVAGAVATGAVLTVVLGVLLWEADAERFSGVVASMNIFGVMVFDRADPGQLDVVAVSVAAALAALVLAIVSLRSTPTLVTLVIVGSLGLVVALEVRVASPFKDVAHGAYLLGPEIAELDPDRVAVASDGYRMVGLNEYQHENPGIRFEVVDDPLETGDDVVIHRREWPEGVAAGARRVAEERNWDTGLWVLPGPLQDRLADDGRFAADAGRPAAAAVAPPEPPSSDPPPAGTSPPPAPTTPTEVVPPPPPTTPEQGDGTFAVAAGGSGVVGTGAVRRFSVEVEGGLGANPATFAATVEAALFDDRSWAGGAPGGAPIAFQRVDAGPTDFRVVLASPVTTDALCAPLRTNGIFSCHQGGRVVINARRWREGAAPSGLGVDDYRTYVVNHEVGHALGHGHRSCPAAGAPAPVMMQQTKGIGACAPNPWPLADERNGA